MIDFENLIVDAVANGVNEKFEKAEIVSEYIPKPSVFPHVYIRETDNSSDVRSFRLNGGEVNARLSYTVDVYSNRQNGKKAECKAVMSIIDSIMQKYHFQRSFCNPFPNENDASIYRMVARYTKLQSSTMEV